MIRFQKLEIEGFGSIQTPITVRFNKKGLILVRGNNGVGKTTIFSALGWVCYGTGLKKNASILTWEQKRFKDYSGAMVKLTLSKDNVKYEIIRCKEYTKKIDGVQGKNRVLIYEDGNLLPDAKLRQANPYIQNLLGMSFELFKTSIIFGQKMKRLIEEDGPTKKKILEEICEISYIEKAKALSEKKLTEARRELSLANNDLTEIQTSIEAKEEELDRLYALEKTWIEDRDKRVDELVSKAEAFISKCPPDFDSYGDMLNQIEKSCLSFKNQYNDLKAKLADLPKEQTAYDRATSRRSALKEANEKLFKSLEDLNKGDKGDPLLCPTCGQGMGGKNIELCKHNITTDFNTNKKSIEILNQAILGHKNKLASMQKIELQADAIYSKYQKELEKFRTLESNVKEFNGYIDRATELKDEAHTLLHKVPEFNIEKVKSQIEVLKEELEPIEDLVLKWTKKVKIYNWMISVPLSNSGLKSFIFNQMVQKINQRLSVYAPKIGFLPKMVVDLNSARKDINMVVYQGKYPIPYEDLSGGQSQLVNIAIAFSVHDVVAEDVFNLLVLDEVFESLSAENVELVASMIADKSHKKAIYLITHLKDFFPETHQVLEITIPGGATELLLN